MLRALCSGLGTYCARERSFGEGLSSPGGGLLIPSFSEAKEFKLPLALPAGVGEAGFAGFAPFWAALNVGIWL